MKPICIVPVLIFLILMLAYQCSSAQDYVVTSRNDTIRGDVKPLLYGPEKKVQVTTADRKKTVYAITQTKSFVYKNDVYHPVRNERGYVYMKALQVGYLTLYAFQLDNQATYDGRYLVKRDGGRLEVPNLGFKKAMSKFLDDCETVAARISEGELNKTAMTQIVDEYNRCIEGRTSESIKVITANRAQEKNAGPWQALEEKVKAEPEFEGKKDALDMIAEAKKKVASSEKIPNFLLEGLKSALAGRNVQPELENALKQVGN
jgi:hypothetical protein